MSHRRTKQIYCLTIVAVAIVLDFSAGWLGWGMAIVILTGALPMFRAIMHVGAERGARYGARRGINLYRHQRQADQSRRSASAQTYADIE